MKKKKGREKEEEGEEGEEREEKEGRWGSRRIRRQFRTFKKTSWIRDPPSTAPNDASPNNIFGLSLSTAAYKLCFLLHTWKVSMLAPYFSSSSSTWS